MIRFDGYDGGTWCVVSSVVSPSKNASGTLVLKPCVKYVVALVGDTPRATIRQTPSVTTESRLAHLHTLICSNDPSLLPLQEHGTSGTLRLSPKVQVLLHVLRYYLVPAKAVSRLARWAGILVISALRTWPGRRSSPRPPFLPFRQIVWPCYLDVRKFNAKSTSRVANSMRSCTDIQDFTFLGQRATISLCLIDFRLPEQKYPRRSMLLGHIKTYRSGFSRADFSPSVGLFAAGKHPARQLPDATHEDRHDAGEATDLPQQSV